MRILADEISFYNQAIVIVPDIYRGQPWMKERSDKYSSISARSATADDDSVHNKDKSIRLREGVNNAEVELNTEYSEEYVDWLLSHPAERVFDDIVSCMRYCRLQYDSKAISLAGVGCGGGWALRAACDLSDIRCAAETLSASTADLKAAAAAAGAGAASKDEKKGNDVSSSSTKPRTFKLVAETRKPVNLFLKETEFKKAADAMLKDVQGLQGLDDLLDNEGSDISSEGVSRLQEAVEDLNSASADEDANDSSGKSQLADYEVLEAQFKRMDSDASAGEAAVFKSRAERGAGLIAENAMMSLEEVAKFEPRAVVAYAPSFALSALRGSAASSSRLKATSTDANAATTADNDNEDASAANKSSSVALAEAEQAELQRIGEALRVPSFLVFGEADSSPGAR
jgi:dienelactone hydrolase